MGSMITAPTSAWPARFSFMIFSKASMHLASSAMFSCQWTARGYLRTGRGAIGQSQVATLAWLTALSLQLKSAIDQPCEAWSKPRTVRLLKSLLCFTAYEVRATLKAASLAELIEPSVRCTWDVPEGAIGITCSLRRSAQSLGGRLEQSTLPVRNLSQISSCLKFDKQSSLYPRGWGFTRSRMVLPSVSTR